MSYSRKYYRKIDGPPLIVNPHFSGFTLIELLIVVAIIAILAAITIPNFLAAQVRAKVSRAKGDMKSIATAVEAYDIDYNAYPPLDGKYYVTPVTLTTPISYLSNHRLPDPFAIGVVDPSNPYPGEEQYYTYQNLQQLATDSTLYPGVDWVNYRGYFGKWRQASLGPDRDYFNGGNGSYLVYDPTNGIMSLGNVWLGQKVNYGDGQYDPNVQYSE